LNIKNKIIGFIPARKNSVRIKNKNLKLFNKRPLIYYSIKSSLKSKYISKTIVYTDSSKIRSISKQYGAITYSRPKKISQNKTSMYDTIKYFLKKNNTYKNYDYMALLQPTSPLRTFVDIDKAFIKLINDRKADGIISTFTVKNINKKNYPDKFMYKRKGYLIKIRKNKIKNKKTYFLRNGPAIFIFKIKSLKRKLYDIKLLNYNMSKKKSLDINYPEDLNINYNN
jgi:CMP-N,N'-diacetyllegionaminic acid synthase